MKKYAIFFPQFHQVQVNDDAWGLGFTDWALVATANAFNYWNRRAPACGFYDLSITNVVEKRFEEAACAGLDGFGIYHYRFEDGPELVAVERYLLDAKLPKDFGYFFIWANESWSRRWAGKDTDLLKITSTEPTLEQVREHVEYLKPFMESTWYTRLENHPIFVIYRPEFFKDPAVTVSLYREEFKRAGINPAIGFFLKSSADIEYSKFFDFCYLFEPRLFFNFNSGKPPLLTIAFKQLLHLIPYSKLEAISDLAGRILNRGSQSHSFKKFLAYFNSSPRKQLVKELTCPAQNVLTSGWNNAPRYRDRFVEVQVPNKEQFSEMLTVSLSDPLLSKHIPLLCNAWNEWSEGAALESCNYLGDALQKAYLSSGTDEFSRGRHHE